MTTMQQQERPTFDQAALAGLINRVKEQPEAGRTVWKATTNWLGGFRSQAQIRGFTVKMDEPCALGGSDSAPNMVEIVLGAYGCCLTTGYAANAALRGIELEDIQIELEGDLDLNGFFGLQDPELCWPGYTNVRAKVTLKAPKSTPEELQALHDAVLKTSPVGSILQRPIQVSTELNV
ncbi:MAG: osmotically inducible protein OsmC [Chloroflexi bacterium]|nr:MAG: osmotically inducible protein OsmC [Chloroflexota bacterium]